MAGETAANICMSEDARIYEAGVTSPIGGDIRWTGKLLTADSEAQALDLFQAMGYYRNLVVRQVPGAGQ
jgi:hypothetical protein